MTNPDQKDPSETERTQIKFMYPKDDPAVPVLTEETKRLSSLRLSIHEVARAYLNERIDLVSAGWNLSQPNTGTVLGLLVTEEAEAREELGVARATLRKRLSNPNLTDQEADQVLKDLKILPKALEVGMMLYAAGLDLDDSLTLESLIAIVQSPALHKFVKALAKADEKQIKQILRTMSKANVTHG